MVSELRRNCRRWFPVVNHEFPWRNSLNSHPLRARLILGPSVPLLWHARTAEPPANATIARCSPASRRAADGAPHAGFGLDAVSAPRHLATIGGPGIRTLIGCAARESCCEQSSPLYRLSRPLGVPALLTTDEVAATLRTSRARQSTRWSHDPLPGRRARRSARPDPRGRSARLARPEVARHCRKVRR